MVTVNFGVNELNLELAGQSLTTAKNQLKSVLGLAGDESVKLNGSTSIPADYILSDGDSVEFVKE